ncbi:MAG: hypothetical protein IJY94_00955 [Clostridia bacterium]|nr:hypothetical protein [Clostridia bacterium]
MDIYYDDRINLNELIGGIAETVEIKDQVVTSNAVYSDKKDENVLVFDQSKFRVIAAGTGTATLVVDGKEYYIRVSPAPISVVIITGHSMGSGSKGNAEESVVCEAGQAYNTTLTINAETYGNNWKDDLKGSTLGYTSSDRVLNIDAITKDADKAKGARGVNSGLAYQWNKLTGEKIWVINCAVGGSCVNQWQPGQKWAEYTLEAMNYFANILKNEVEAGHYEYRTTSMINFSTSNFGYQKVEFDDEKLTKWHDDMWKFFSEGVTVDIDGDGQNDGITSIGYVPDWTRARTAYSYDAPLIYFRAMSKKYPNVFLASDYPRYWRTDAGVARSFPKINYSVQNGSSLIRPTTSDQIYADTNGHYFQVAYNAQGFEIANALYGYVNKTHKVEAFEFYDITDGGNPVAVKDSITLKLGKRYQFVLISDSFAASDIDIDVSDNLGLENLFYITAKAKGNGTITIKQGDRVIKTVNVEVN